jgi:hypothetical protein
MSNESKNPLSILSPDDIHWFGRWLSRKQMLEGIASLKDPSRNLAFDTLEAARSRVEAGLPPYGNLWEEPSMEERRKLIEASRKRVESYRI